MEEVVFASAEHEVSADNYEEFEQEIDASKLGLKLIQQNPLKGSIREYQFYDNSHLLLNLVAKKSAKEKKFRLDLAWLSSEPEHNKIIVWKWLHYALTAGVLAGLFLYLGIEQVFEPDYFYIAATIALTTTLIFALTFIYCMRDEYFFKSYYGNAKLFLIENKKPEQSEFDGFFICLQQNIDNAQSKLSVIDRLVGELKMCRRLKDEGIIDDETYTAVRTTIFKHDQYKI